jgi:hypothetical protein
MKWIETQESQKGESKTVYDGRAPARALPDVVAAFLRPYFAAAESANSVAMVL